MTPLEKTKARMKEASVDALLVTDELNQRYLSNFSFSDGLLFITQKSAHLITDFRYCEMAERRADREFSVVMPDDRFAYINRVAAEESCHTVGFEGGSVTYDAYKRYAEHLAPLELVNIGAILEEVRQIKSPEEIALMQKAQDITDIAFGHILKNISLNMTELDIAAELEYAMRKNGADGLAFETIAVSGDASALPHGRPRNEKLHRGFLTMDFGARFDGYCSDMTRTVVIGKADEEMKKLYNTVLSAQRAALNFLRCGVDCGEVDKLARDIIDKDYSGCFGHSLGHSVGLYIHESPGFSRRSFGKKAVCGNVFTVEPGIYVYGKYGCRIEDMVEIRRDGVHNFTNSTKELIEII